MPLKQFQIHPDIYTNQNGLVQKYEEPHPPSPSYHSLSIQDFDTVVSSKISLEMESLKTCKESLISMEFDTFDRLRSGLNSFHGELL